MDEKVKKTIEEESKDLSQKDVLKKIYVAVLDTDMTVNALGAKLSNDNILRDKKLEEINKNIEKTNESIKKLTEAILSMVEVISSAD